MYIIIYILYIIYIIYIIYYIYYILYITGTGRIMEKTRFNLQAPPVYDRKVTNLFFSIIMFSIIIFFHNSVGDCMSIDSQFECI